MTADMVKGIVRAVLAALGGYVAAKGWFDAAGWNEIVGAVPVVIAAIWSVASKKSA